MDTLKKLIQLIDDLPMVAKLVLCIPILDIVWSVYRLSRSIVANNVLGIVVGILLIVPGATFVWLIDLVCLLINGKIWTMD